MQILLNKKGKTVSYSKFFTAALAAMFVIFAPAKALGQCLDADNGQWPPTTYTPSCTGSAGTITTCGFGSEYSRVNVTDGEIYEFGSSVGTDFITISNADGDTAFAWGQSPLAWQATFTGVVRFYTHLDASCPFTGGGGCRTKTVLCPATLPLIPELGITPVFGSIIDMGTGGMGDVLTETITAENVGTADLDLDCSLSNDDGGVFTLLPSDPFSVTLEPTDGPVDMTVQCTVPTLAPGASETYNGELACTTNDTNFPGQNTFALTCEGEGPAPVPELDIAPPFGSLIDFGSGGAGDQLSEIVALENAGNVDAELDCTLSDNAGGVFSLLPSDPLSIIVAPASDPESLELVCSLPELFPGTSESYAGVLTCTTNDPEFPGDNTFDLACGGTGGPALPVPTFGRWGMLMLMFGLLLLAGFQLRAGRAR